MVPAVAANVFEVDPAATVADAGTVKSPLLLDSDTTAPPAGAAADKVTVHVEVPALPKLEGLQDNELTAVAAAKEMVAGCELPL